jgi:bifunctional oligoribonuclease and PAP phosphatase NrnA
MSYQKALSSAGRFLKENDHFLVINHVSPDGDATGSLLAMGHILSVLGKTFVLANEGVTPEKFLFLPLGNQIVNLSDDILDSQFNKVIALDCGDEKRMGKAVNYMAEDATLLNIDHHQSNDSFGAFNLIRTDACATAEILFDLVKEMGLSLTKDLAMCLYTGILTDTGGFRYSNTDAVVMNKAAELLSAGVEPAVVAERCLETITSSYIRLLQLVFPTLSLEMDGKVASLIITTDAMKESTASLEDMEGIVNYARNIEGVEVGILYKQIDSTTVKVSLRSRSIIDVANIAKAVGGGGHARAAGCTIQGDIKEVQGLVLEKVRQAWVAK